MATLETADIGKTDKRVNSGAPYGSIAV